MFRMWPSYDNYIDALKAISEPTRFRLVRLCAQGELTVSELMRIVGQSQPRVSRHLKLLQDAGILERFREQHWVFYRVAQEEHYQLLVSGLIKQIEKNETIIQLDQSRLIELQAARAPRYLRHLSKPSFLIGCVYTNTMETQRVLKVPSKTLSLKKRLGIF
jgi:DNA-binding transcriptional ArsR family regulator